jgi:Ca2+-transporting ATPase
MAEIFWHNLSWEETIKISGTDAEKGLEEKDVVSRQMEFGKNEIAGEKPLSGLKILLDQFKSPLIYILIIAGIITLLLKDFTDSIVIFGAVILNTIVGYFQESKASKTLQELKKIVKQTAQVIREGREKLIDSTEMVPGDIFVLNVGEKVPADGRVIESHNLTINEMALTGEWLSAKKDANPLAKDTPLADRNNMVYMGTIVEDGKGRAMVTEISSQTEIGEVAKILKETKEEKTPLQKKLAKFSKIIGGLIALIAVFIFIEGMVTGKNFLEILTTSVAIAVAAIPEGLPVAMTVILALGMQRILKKKGLVRKLASAESLGSTSIIATDKTATLTEGRMKVADVIAPSKELALKIAVLCSDAFIENPEEEMEKMIIRGRPTDRALVFAGAEAGIFRNELEKKEKRIDEMPFDPIHKYSATVHQISESEFRLSVIGAPEKLMEISNLAAEEKRKLERQLEKSAGKGLRIIALAYREIRATQSSLPPVKKLAEDDNLVFYGLITLKDPVRKEAKSAIRLCRQAGMRPIIVTGDHKLTAKAVAEELGFKIKAENILEGKDLDKLEEKEFAEILPKIDIYARVEPKHKMRIIEAWQTKGEVVAMTGDGINDAPALKKADIGVALGSGTEVAKETSDLILLNDGFDIIVAAVEEGRLILDNIRKVITYLLSDSFTEIILIAVSIAGGFPLPVTAVQILWVNLIEDGLPDFALAFEPKEKDLLKLKPHNKKTPLLTKEMKAIIFVIGILTDLLLLGLFFWLLNKNHDISYVRTMIFAGLATNSLFYVFSCKSLRNNIWRINPFSNKFLVGAVFIGFAMLVMGIYVPLFQTLLKTVSLGFTDWIIIFSLGLANIILIEAAKWYFISRRQTS